MYSEIIKKRKANKNNQGLLLTSMMDMFTIILVFLLVNMSGENQKFAVDKNLALPESTSEITYKDAVSIVLTRDSIMVDNTKVADVKGNIILKEANDKITTLYNFLVHKRSKENLKEPMVFFQADKMADFEIIDKIMKTAAFAGFANFQFAVLRKAEN